MKLLLDENIPLELINLLKGKNLEVKHILYTNLKSASDEAIFKYAVKNKMTIITFDEDFLDDKFFTETHYGIILTKKRSKNLEETASIILNLLKSSKTFKNKIIRIE